MSIATKERGTRPNRAAETAGLLSSDEIGRILDNRDASIVDSLIIWKVDYYFHHHVMTLNYFTASAHRAYIGPGTVRLGADMWEDPTYVNDVMQRRLTYAGGMLATHPIGFIGGNSKGVDELLSVLPRLKWSYNRNSGATYPFPGTWQTVGPFGATEKVHGRDVPPIRKAAVEEKTGRAQASVLWHDLIEDDYYLIYRSESIVLLPDWERIADLVLENAEVRRKWAWLILPIRFGFPTVESPGAGVLKKTNLGNLAAVAPPFTTGWNRVGPTSNFHVYAPHVLRVPLATSNPIATSQSGLGVLNLAALAWALTPGGNVAVATIMPWAGAAMHVLGYPPPRTFATGPVKLRFATEGQGVVYRFGGDGFARMLPRHESASLSQLLAPDTSWSVDEASLRRDAGAAPHVLLDLHFTRRVSIENTFSWDATELTQTIRTPEGVPIGTVRGLLNHRELTGGFRFNVALFLEDALQLYVRAGYGWTWYKLRDVSFEEERLDEAPFRGGYAPTLYPSRLWWPNTWIAGAGVELFSPRRMRFFQTRTLGYGVRIDATALRHRLDVDTPGQRGNRPVTWGDASIAVVLGW